MPPSHPNTSRLPVLKTVIESYLALGRNAGTLIRFGWVNLLLILALSYWQHSSEYQIWILPRRMLTDPWFLWSLYLWSVALTVLCATLAVQWHRFLLLGEDPAKNHYLSLNSLGRRYLLRVIIFYLAFWAVLRTTGLLEKAYFLSTNAVMPMWAGNAVALVSVCLSQLLLSRFWLVLPAVALGHLNIGLVEAWKTTRGNAFRLAIGAFLAICLCKALSYAFFSSGNPLLAVSRSGYIFSRMALDIIEVFAGMTYVTFLSLAYRHFFGPFEQCT